MVIIHTSTDTILANNIKVIRMKLLNASQNEFAEMLNVKLKKLNIKSITGATISNWEKALHKPDIDKLKCICELGNISIDDITNIEISEEYLNTKKQEEQLVPPDISELLKDPVIADAIRKIASTLQDQKE